MLLCSLMRARRGLFYGWWVTLGGAAMHCGKSGVTDHIAEDDRHALLIARNIVRELGLVGALVNGFSQVGDPETVVYLDDPRYADFWARLAELEGEKDGVKHLL